MVRADDRRQREAVAAVARRLPRHMARTLAAGPVGRRLAASQAGAIVTARMNLGHRLILDLRAPAQRNVYFTGWFDDDLLMVARGLLDQRGAVAVDVGANVGLWTIPLAHRAAHVAGEVLAFEPVHANAHRLQENIILNGVEAFVTVEETALSDDEGTLRMALREDFDAGAATGNASVVIADGRDVDFEQVDVPMTCLDDAVDLPDRQHIAVMKIDAEGHEDRILTGGRDTLAEHRPVVFIEWNTLYHDRRGTDPTQLVTAAMDGLSYASLARVDGGWQVTRTYSSHREIDDLVLAPTERVADVLDRLHAAT